MLEHCVILVVICSKKFPTGARQGPAQEGAGEMDIQVGAYPFVSTAGVPTSHNPPHTHSLPGGPSHTNGNPWTKLRDRNHL